MTIRAFVTAAIAAAAMQAATPQPLRTVSINNVFPITNVGIAYDTVRGRYRHQIGSGDVNGIRVSLYNWALLAAGAGGSGSARTYTKIALEKGDGSAYAPVTFGGSRSVTLNSGDSKVNSDVVLPSALGLTTFARGSYVWVRYEYTCATSPTVSTYRNRNEPTGQTTWLFNSASAVYSPVDGTGAMAFVSGTAGTGYGRVAAPVLLGTFASGDPLTYAVAGDSISDGYGDAADVIMGAVQRALIDPDKVSNPYAAIMMGANGGNTQIFTNDPGGLARGYFVYCNRGIEEFGTNAIGAGAQTSLLSECKTIWGYMYAAGITKVLRTKLLRYTTDSWTTSSLTSTGTTATLAIATGTLPTVGQPVTISGATPAAYNGTFTVTRSGGGSFDYTMASAPGTAATGTVLWSNNWCTSANQAYASASWGPGGAVDLLNNNASFFPGQVGAAGGITVLSDWGQDSAEVGNPLKWKTNGTTAKQYTMGDMHPNPAAYDLMTTRLRSDLSTMG